MIDRLANSQARLVDETVYFAPFEQELDTLLDDDEPGLVRVVFAADLAEELLEKLAYEGFTPAHLMPTYDNVVETIKLYRRIGIGVGWDREGH